MEAEVDKYLEQERIEMGLSQRNQEDHQPNDGDLFTESIKYLKRVFSKKGISIQKLALAREAVKFHETKAK